MKNLLVVFGVVAFITTTIAAKPGISFSFPPAISTPVQKTYSQHTQTWFMDGHKELQTWYTDGSHDSWNERCPIPTKGSPKHFEWVWKLVDAKTGRYDWVLNVAQYY